MTSYPHRCDICGAYPHKEYRYRCTARKPCDACCVVCHQARVDSKAQREDEMNTEVVNQ